MFLGWYEPNYKYRLQDSMETSCDAGNLQLLLDKGRGPCRVCTTAPMRELTCNLPPTGKSPPMPSASALVDVVPHLAFEGVWAQPADRNEDTVLVWGRIPIIDAHAGSRAGLCCDYNVRGFELRASRLGGPRPPGRGGPGQQAGVPPPPSLCPSVAILPRYQEFSSGCHSS
jgi:hypothetical protein